MSAHITMTVSARLDAQPPDSENKLQLCVCNSVLTEDTTTYTMHAQGTALTGNSTKKKKGCLKPVS